ncbi:hypothetical protein BAE44_0015711 [Dichanthelium oligosanthes]|uniref:Uncharacterized protein n=1 Tax=Dichanthelium oligosanthes TaxID=888268 RepID=A0A1E5VDP5_9POAL|nr:hypothetical protein BAE44_0015711 [Dichanthelium oligosanthes]
MRNANGSFWCSPVAVLQQVLGPQAAPHGLGLQLMQRLGAASSPGGTEGDGVMPPLLFRALASLNLLLLVGYLLLVLLAKLFARLHLRATAKDPTRTTVSALRLSLSRSRCRRPMASPSISRRFRNRGMMLRKKESSREEDDARRDTAADDDRGEHAAVEDHAASSISEGQQHDVKLFVNSRALADTRKFLLEGVVAGAGGGAKLQDDKDRNGDSSRFGASTLTSESTSKSSVEWQSSTVTKDSETEYPFSSSSRRSSARWESYTLFRKYDEDMVYFHRVGAQKLTETESFRSIQYQPRSISERIVQKLTPKPSAPIGLRDPYPDLERAYVAQVCLTWEALNWNYTSFRRHNGGDGNIAARCCPARVAQEFQQFQVLLHRFIENEPYEYGRRPEVYARMKNSTPKLLLVPEFRDEDDEKDDLISALQFLLILEESIRTFMTFLRADKRSHYEMFREMVKRRSSAVDQTLVITLKKANKRKKSRLKDLTRPRRCLKRTKLREEEELSILLGLIDVKVVARVLRMPEITDQQLHWCEEKMNRVRVDLKGKMQRDPSPLFYPAH